MDYHQPLLPGHIYHIVSRAVGTESLFNEEENYRFFLQRYSKYICPVADTFAYSLLKNHFHFLVEIKSEELLLPLFKTSKPNIVLSERWAETFVMQQWSNLLNSYSKSFNKRYNRKGSLFIDALKRVEVTSDEQFSATIFYIHKNPVHHGFCEKMGDWRWCSYNAMLSELPTILQRDYVIQWFGDLETFIKFHEQPIHLKEAIALE